MATIIRTETTITVQVPVQYRGKIPIDGRRLSWLEGKMQEAAKEIENTLAILRFTDEPT